MKHSCDGEEDHFTCIQNVTNKINVGRVSQSLVILQTEIIVLFDCGLLIGYSFRHMPV